MGCSEAALRHRLVRGRDPPIRRARVRIVVSGLQIADGRQGRLRLRVVRHLPVRAELAQPGEAWGQVLDKPPGRKPRGRADEDQRRRDTMGI